MSTKSFSKLFEPLVLGGLRLQHRIVLAPLTRWRADDAHILPEYSVEYYEQRAREPGTLLISEGVMISEESGGYAHTPAIYNDDQIKSWRKVRLDNNDCLASLPNALFWCFLEDHGRSPQK